jgi:hypothetical protein
MQTWEDQSRKTVLHFDSANPYTAQPMIGYMNRTRLVRALYPPFSPDLAHPYFYLFGKVKKH